ncbi:MAG: PDZ domain-containing protein [Pirellula sp.]
MKSTRNPTHRIELVRQRNCGDFCSAKSAAGRLPTASTPSDGLHFATIGKRSASRTWSAPKVLILVLCILVLLFHGSAVNSQNAEETERSKQLQAWIADLGDPDYSRRQYATIQLNLNKAESVRLVVKALEIATGEQADRLFHLVSSIASDPYSGDGEFAFKAIENIAKHRSTSRATRAQKILQAIGNEQQEAAQDKLLHMGIDIRDRQMQVISSRVEVRNALVIDPSFTGVEADLECLRWLSMVEFVKLEGPRISRETLKHVIKIPNLKRLQLINTNLQSTDIDVLLDAPDLDLLEFVYAPIGDESIELLTQLPVIGDLYLFGTKLSADGQRDLKARIDGPDLLVSRGGFLGIQCQHTSVIIEDVVANGAAEAAGLRRRDKILSINSVPVYIFEDIRRELANHAAGEQVVVKIERMSFYFDEKKQELKTNKEILEIGATLLRRPDAVRER